MLFPINTNNSLSINGHATLQRKPSARSREKTFSFTAARSLPFNGSQRSTNRMFFANTAEGGESKSISYNIIIFVQFGDAGFSKRLSIKNIYRKDIFFDFLNLFSSNNFTLVWFYIVSFRTCSSITTVSKQLSRQELFS